MFKLVDKKRFTVLRLTQTMERLAMMSVHLIKAKFKNKCTSGNESENFRWGRHTYFYAPKGTLGGI